MGDNHTPWVFGTIFEKLAENLNDQDEAVIRDRKAFALWLHTHEIMEGDYCHDEMQADDALKKLDVPFVEEPDDDE